MLIGKWGEEYDMSPKEICDVLSNNKCYYKEVFDLYGPMRRKIRAYHESKQKQSRGARAKPQNKQ